MPRTIILKRNGCCEPLHRCLRDCHSVCVETIIHCLNMGGKHAETSHVRLMRDCADMCEESEEFMLRGSEFINSVCSVCTDICDRCAESCDAFDDQEMKTCAQSCRDCSSACREMSGSS